MRVINNIRDKVRTYVYSKFYDFKNSKVQLPFSWQDITTIVIYKVDGKLGDTEIISPFLRTLQNQCPNLDIIVICPSPVDEIYKKNLNIIHTITCSKRPKRSELTKISQIIGKCDAFLTLEEKFRFHDFYILHLLKPTLVAGINGNVHSINIRLSDYIKGKHITEYFNFLLKNGGIKEENILHTYTPLSTNEATKKMKPLCKKGQIAFAPWGASKHKHLSNTVIIKIINAIIYKNIPIVLLLPSEAKSLKQIIFNEIKSELLVAIPDKINVNELAALIENSSAIISVDTANIHLACAYDLPILGIYNGTDQSLRTLWAPLSSSQKTQVIYCEGKLIDQLSFSDISQHLEKFINSTNETS